MKEFFGWGGYTREPEGYMSWQHILLITTICSLQEEIEHLMILFTIWWTETGALSYDSCIAFLHLHSSIL